MGSTLIAIRGGGRGRGLVDVVGVVLVLGACCLSWFVIIVIQAVVVRVCYPILHHAPLIPAGMNPFHWNPPESTGMTLESTGMDRNPQEWNRNGQEWHWNGIGMD